MWAASGLADPTDLGGKCSSISDMPAATRTTANLISAVQFWAGEVFSETAFASDLTCLRQLNTDISLTPFPAFTKRDC